MTKKLVKYTIRKQTVKYNLIASKLVKYLRINLNKEVQGVNNENNKTLLKETKLNLNKNALTCLYSERRNVFKIAMLPNLVANMWTFLSIFSVQFFLKLIS